MRRQPLLPRKRLSGSLICINAIEITDDEASEVVPELYTNTVFKIEYVSTRFEKILQQFTIVFDPHLPAGVREIEYYPLETAVFPQKMLQIVQLTRVDVEAYHDTCKRGGSSVIVTKNH